MRMEIVRRMSVPELPVGMVVQSGKDHGLTGAARRCRAKCIAEPRPLASQPVHVGSLDDRVAIAPRDRRVIIGYKQQDVAVIAFRSLRESRRRGRAQKLSAIHVSVIVPQCNSPQIRKSSLRPKELILEITGQQAFMALVARLRTCSQAALVGQAFSLPPAFQPATPRRSAAAARNGCPTC